MRIVVGHVSRTKPGIWLQKHGWKLHSLEPHGFATTHYWISPHDGKCWNQTYALMEQRRINKRSKVAV